MRDLHGSVYQDLTDERTGTRIILAIEAEARADPHLHDGCFQRGTLTAEYIDKQRAEARAAALDEARAAVAGVVEHGYYDPMIDRALYAIDALLEGGK